MVGEHRRVDYWMEEGMGETDEVAGREESWLPYRIESLGSLDQRVSRGWMTEQCRECRLQVIRVMEEDGRRGRREEDGKRRTREGGAAGGGERAKGENEKRKKRGRRSRMAGGNRQPRHGSVDGWLAFFLFGRIGITPEPRFLHQPWYYYRNLNTVHNPPFLAVNIVILNYFVY